MSRTQYCRGISWLLFAFLIVVGCDDPGVPAVPTLDVAPAGTRLTALHDSVRLFVTAHDGTNPVQIETAEWESKSAAIFSVNDDGWVTALANGVANGAVNALGQSKLFSVEVSQTPCPGTGMSHELKVRDLGAVWSIDVRDCNAYRIAPEDAEFHSSGPNVISIGSDGVATAVGTGTAIITVTAGGTSVNLAVTIEGDPIGLRVTPAGPIVMTALGDTVLLSATLNDVTLNVGFESSNPLSVFVDEEGRLVSIDGGHAFVTAWVHEHPDVRQVIDVTVQQAVCSVNDVPALPPVLTIGYSWAIVAFDCNGHHIDPINVAFTTSNPSVVGVDPNGVATIVGPGTATVAVAAGGRSIERTFSIGPAQPVVLDIAPAGPIRVTSLGEVVQLVTTAFDDLGQVVPDVRVGWESSNPGGVPVDQGVVTVNSVDTVTVIAWLLDYPDVRDTVTILVDQVPCDIVVVPPVVILAIGERWQIVVRDCNGYPIEPPAVTFSSSNPNVVSVDENGFVTVIGPGVAIITVTVAGRSSTASVAVN